jgi:hypothetical protein
MASYAAPWSTHEDGWIASRETAIMWDRHRPEDAGLVGTPYFWTGVAGSVAVWAALMLALWW